MRQLMLRLVDVEEIFPGEYDYYEDIKDEYLPDFLKREEDRDYIYSVETSRGGGYKLIVTDWSTDYRRDTVIKIPSFILDENWCNDVESQKISRRINEIDKEINKIEVIMASGTGQIMELNYCIAGVEGQIKTAERYIVNTILAFPTAEMRDAFYEVFREEIEICKELL